ncbi:ABC transporter ATP-binding protein [Salidesulfovibrio brasiliensis]|uniref:ABC transporter ATP-binding protein n=1 Tax=Salidesulfovibrio brasiliensis TaxID=221711 RepID=UPI001FE0C846|nr:ABC transporter ATP-binding protein [Salidesulfovibrio brasiliensis]
MDLDIKLGKVLLLMGPSGSGKTTLLSIMGCILSPTSGTVTIADEVVTDLPGSKLSKVRLKHLGFIFQEYNLFSTLTVLENVLVAMHLRGFDKPEARRGALKVLDDVGLSDKVNAYPKTLSGGQKQRVAIARALAGGPKVILADEPTAALDSENGRRVMELMASLVRDGTRSLVIVTHDARTLEFADEVMNIEDGELHPAEGPEHQREGAHP